LKFCVNIGVGSTSLSHTCFPTELRRNFSKFLRSRTGALVLNGEEEWCREWDSAKKSFV